MAIGINKFCYYNYGGGYIFVKTQISKLEQRLMGLETDFFDLENSVIVRTNGNYVYNGNFNYLAIGNSITQHDPSNAWPGSWGVAASTANKDYFHLVVNGLNQTKGKTDARCVCFPSWETLETDRAETILIIDSLISNNLDLVTIQLGENVPTGSTFEADLSYLVEYIQKKAEGVQIIIVGNFWPNYKLDEMKKAVCEKYNLAFISLLEIQNNKGYESYVGASISGADGDEHTIADEMTAKHPNDRGHRFIADEILKAIK